MEGRLGQDVRDDGRAPRRLFVGPEHFGAVAALSR
jgi:hypothetical protein